MEYGRLKKGTLPPQPGPDPDELRNFRVFGWPLFFICACIQHGTCILPQCGLTWDFPGGLSVKNLPAMQEMRVLSLAWQDPLEESMATHSSIFA